ncbi:sec-independent protein translocase protein TatA [Kitasatospora sp. MAA19]|uniref:Sec-independent protein translocase subunit TatA n=1 Tax=unclassified Kitasatospora TaxID=2633591 RepID=UPI00247537F7|nr:Sec-independent protein translocase subunit TatA [Kitasatospora sp. MAA19]MDH6704868.1 sec-independent protein translocase protein TatA [Kitasatospora sp. MAA19]
MLRNGLEPWHLLVVLAVVVLLFGSKKLPEMARGLGKSMRILKAETKALREDDAPADAAQNTTAQSTAAPGAGTAQSTAAQQPAAVTPTNVTKATETKRPETTA